jgi:ferrous iron transport protein B
MNAQAQAFAADEILPDTLRIALVGNPNCGKTALFNRLTGARQKVANYAGVTVERKQGSFTTPAGRTVQVLDLPGTYSLDAMGPDEIITRDVCLGRHADEAIPDLIVCVADATNLRLHLRFALEVRALGRPMVLALNLIDAARARGIVIDTNRLSVELGMPVIETVAVKADGASALIAALDGPVPPAPATKPVADLHLETRRLLAAAVVMPEATSKIDDAIDRVVLHPVLGLVLLAVIMFLVFQAVFAWAKPPMDAITVAVAWLSGVTTQTLPDGLLKGFLTDAIFGGLGNVIVFLPQILILFFFILSLEESGYLPRAAFLLDKLMSVAGLTGRSFIPLLSSFACAIPGIMATRSIHDSRDRLTTIMVAPLMTCSARWPVYTLLVGAFIPQRTFWGVVNLQGLVLFGLLITGIVSAFVVSWVIKLTRKDRREHPLMMELPSYRLPNARNLGLGLFERAKIFMRRITGVIFAANAVLWVLTTFPLPPAGASGAAINYSVAGMVGHVLQPLFAAIGFNWQICVALIPGMAAREVAVAALGTVYSVQGSEDAVRDQLGHLIAGQWPLPTALSLLAWYVFAPQCLSTLAVIRRETNTWKYVAITAGYLFALAYAASFVTYQIAVRV